MIREIEFYHGAAIGKIAHYSNRSTSIQPFPSLNRASYVINDRIGLYLKHSSNRMTPWSFSFSSAHQDEVEKMKDKLDKVFVALICGKDGIACLSYKELKHVLDNVHDEAEWIRASRRPREKYAIKGSDGKLFFKIADNSFPERLFRS